jgi:hypothetical protein
MPEIVADSPAPPCSLLLSESEIRESQSLGPDPPLPRARDARGRFAQGSSGNPRGRPPGIRNPKRRIPDLAAHKLSARALADLLDRKPHLLGPLAAQLLPPPHAAIDPAKRLGIDLASMRTAEDCRWVMPTVLAAISRGEITPAEGADIARRVRAWSRWIRKLTRAGAVSRNREKQPPGSVTKGYVADLVSSRRAPLRKTGISVGGENG